MLARREARFVPSETVSITLEQTTVPLAPTTGRWQWGGLASWAVVVVVGAVWGTVRIVGRDQGLGAAPFVGRWRSELDAGLVPAVVFALAVVAVGPRVARALPWRSLVLSAGVAASVWAGLLAANDAWVTPFNRRSDYMRLAVTIDSPLEFLRTFTEQAPTYPVHVKGHPPGATLAFWVLDRVGLGGTGWAGLAVVVAWGVAVAAVLVSIGQVAGRDTARRVAPFVALSPAAVWAAFSADAFFAGVIAAGIALVIVATGCRGGHGMVLAVAGGAVLGLSLHLTYGAVPLLVVPAAVVVFRRRFDLVVPFTVGAAVMTGLFVAAGFWWLDGLSVTHEQYWAGVASRRPWTYYLLAGNPAALALAVGPAAAMGLSRMRRTGIETWLIPVGGLAALAIANFSGMSKGEVERIWLPFVPWVLTATACIAGDRQRRWLATQAGIGLALQALLRSPW